MLFFVSFNNHIVSQNENVKAVFIYNFTKYISWPQSESSGDFIVGVLGSPAMESSLNALAAKKKVGTRDIKVLNFNSFDAIQNAIYFLLEMQKKPIPDALNKVSLLPVVVVTDSPGSIEKGSGINFVEVGGKQKFEITPSKITDKLRPKDSTFYRYS
ncbi:MAG: YfiR family protein [Chloroflexia bacterium]|nr:YfiR family protein [Chloroflexia bacterium]